MSKEYRRTLAPVKPRHLRLIRTSDPNNGFPDPELVAVIEKWRRVRAELGLGKLLDRAIA